MEITTPTPDQFEEYLTLADREISPAGAGTRIWDDFPLLLGADNRSRVLVAVRKGQVAAGAACLVRQFQTSCGTIPIGGIGAVVTHPEWRGQGLSRAVQGAVLDRLEAAQVPLAVLWSDQPEIYAGRGFSPAGWEFHVDLDPLDLPQGLPEGFSTREFEPPDAEAVEAIYDRRPYRACRRPSDATRLYGMPGTRGLVAAGADGRPVAYVFCGKGSDFPLYVAEWGGPVGLVIPLLDAVRQKGWARHLLIPAGGELLAEQLARRGATPVAMSSGIWKVVQPDPLTRYLQASGYGAPNQPADPEAVLGTVGPDGVVVPGALTVAVWGFDSV